MNEFQLEGESELDIHRPDPAAEQRQRSRLDRTKSERDQGQVDTALAAVGRAAEAGENLMPRLIEAARVRVSEGELVAAMQAVFGTYTEHPQF